MRIKVCGLRNQANIGDTIALGCDYIGLVFYPPSPRFAGNEEGLADCARGLTGIKKVGVFVNEKLSVVKDHISTYALDVVQLHGTESPEYCAALMDTAVVWKAFPIGPYFQLDRLKVYATVCHAFLFDSATEQYGGSGTSFDWNLLDGMDIPLPFFLSGGIGIKDLEKVRQFQHPSFVGIDVNSGFEQVPGMKNINLLKEFIDALQN